MRKVVPYLIPYKSIFYLKFLEFERLPFDRINSNWFNFFLNNSEAALFFVGRPTSLPPGPAHAHRCPLPFVGHSRRAYRARSPASSAPALSARSVDAAAAPLAVMHHQALEPHAATQPVGPHRRLGPSYLSH
jgi:hypothetical protein